jgi:hypothetical protein
MQVKRKAFSTFLRSLVILAFIGITAFVSSCWLKDIDTPYYTQTTSYYCGAASAQMILNSEKLGIYVASQTTLYNYIHSHNNSCSTGWASDPVGLTAVLNHYANSHTPPAYFAVNSPTSQDEANKKLAHTIDRWGVPPASLIYGCGHWVVVRGVFTSAQPISASSYSIYGFFVNDPWYGTNTLGENNYIESNTWNTDYFTGCTWCGLTGGARYISVVDPEAPPTVTIIPVKVLQRRQQLISANEAQEFARTAIKQFEEQKEFHQKFAEAVGIMRTSTIGVPNLVQRSDRQKDAYYIVPLTKKGRTAGALLIDGYSGQFKAATYVRRPIDYVRKFRIKDVSSKFKRQILNLKIRPEILSDLSIRRTVAVAGAKEAAQLQTYRQMKLKATDINVERFELVWEPSEESQNPYYPLWKVTGTVKGVREARTLGYLDFKGRAFHEIQKIEKLKLKGG